MSPGKYFSRFWTDNERIQELAESLISASGLSRASPSKLSRHNKALYAEHHSAAAIKAGLQSGTLVQASAFTLRKYYFLSICTQRSHSYAYLHCKTLKLFMDKGESWPCLKVSFTA